MAQNLGIRVRLSHRPKQNHKSISRLHQMVGHTILKTYQLCVGETCCCRDSTDLVHIYHEIISIDVLTPLCGSSGRLSSETPSKARVIDDQVLRGEA